MKRAAIYIRVSTDHQAEEGESLPAQKAKLVRWARENGYIIVEEFADAGASAKVSDRPEFMRMMAAAKQTPRPFDAILVIKWNRFARNAEDALIYKSLLRNRLGMELTAIDEPTGEGPIGQLLERMLDIIAEFQVVMTADHVRDTLTYLASKGRWSGKAPFGYRIGDDGTLTIVEDEAQVIRWFFQEYLRGKPLRHLAEAAIAGRPFKETLRRDYRWSPAAIRKMLRNPAYIGSVVYNRRKNVVVSESGLSRVRTVNRPKDQWIRVDDAHPAIIDRQTWEEVQRRLDGIRDQYGDRPNAREYILRGLVTCGLCGQWMTYRKHTNKAVLACSLYFRVKSRACRPYNWIHLDELVATVRERLAALTEGIPDATTMRIAPPESQPRITPPEEWEQRLARLADAYEAGYMELAEFAARKKRILAQQEAERSLANAVPEPNLAELQDRAQRAVNLIDDPSADIAAVNAALADILSSVVVNRLTKSVEITWRHPDE